MYKITYSANSHQPPALTVFTDYKPMEMLGAFSANSFYSQKLVGETVIMAYMMPHCSCLKLPEWALPHQKYSSSICFLKTMIFTANRVLGLTRSTSTLDHPYQFLIASLYFLPSSPNLLNHSLCHDFQGF